MKRYAAVWRTAAAMLAGVVLTLAVQHISARWNRSADAASIDQLARSTMVNLVQALPWSGNKIRGVAGLGDGRTFIVHTDEQIFFYQLGFGATPTTTPR